MENNPTNVVAAFEFLLEEIEAEIAFLQEMRTEAVRKRDYKSAHEAIERASQVTAFQENVASLQKEWETLTIIESGIAAKEILSATQHHQDRLPQGLRTPESAYYQPILIALLELGGSARMNVVLEKVELLMKKELKPEDYELLPSQPNPPRWKIAARWARHKMMKEGLLKSTSSHGTWEISEKGRMFQKELTNY